MYEEKGEKFLDKLKDVFAFWLYDLKTEVLTIGRDRFGVKPLFYSGVSGEIRFSSEVKSLKISQTLITRRHQKGVL